MLTIHQCRMFVSVSAWCSVSRRAVPTCADGEKVAGELRYFLSLPTGCLSLLVSMSQHEHDNFPVLDVWHRRRM